MEPSKDAQTLKTFPYEEIFNEVPHMVAIVSLEGIVLSANAALIRLSGKTLTQIAGKAFWELDCWLHSDAMQNKILFSMEQSAISSTSVRVETQFRDDAGKINDVDLHIKAVYGDADEAKYFVATGYNVTELVAVRKSLSERERQMQALFEYSQEGYFFNVLPTGLRLADTTGDLGVVLDDLISLQKVIRTNRTFKRILGYEVERDLPTDRAYELLQISGRKYREFMNELYELGEVKFEHYLKDSGGEIKILEITLVAIRNEDSYYGCFGVVRDLTIQRQYEAELEFYANKDPLTSIYNRRTFFNLAKAFYGKQSRRGVVCMLDIDHFKHVNDTYGHDWGDVVLKKLAGLIHLRGGRERLFCRYGGEEFAVLFYDAGIKEAFNWCEGLREEVAELVFEPAGFEPFRITISMGLAEIFASDDRVEQTISRADKALYHSKRNGRNQTTICEDRPQG